MLDEGDDSEHESKKWVNAINKGGLIRVNNPKYNGLVAMGECV